MAKLSLNENETVRLLLQYLESMEYYRALVSLEKDSNVRLRSYGREIDFFYDLIMDGRFEDAEKFINPLKSRSEDSHNKVVYLLRKERFLEALETSNDPKLDDLIGWLKEIESVAIREDYNNLCYCLSLNKITDSPEYKDWSLWGGRMGTFKKCLDYLGEIYPVAVHEEPKTTLMELLAQVQHVEVVSETGNMRSPRQQNVINLRYSHDDEPSDPSVVINDSESDEKRKKAVKFWNAPKADSEEEEEKKVFVEALDIPSATEDHSPEHEPEGFKFSSHELMRSFEPTQLQEVAKVEDQKPIRTSAFNVNGDYFVLGTNSNSLKVCSMHNIVDGLLYDEHQGREQYIDIVFEWRNAHLGSLYCVDWARSETQIASGSNDKTIKVLYCPDFLEIQESQSETLIYSNGEFLNGEGQLPEVYVNELVGHTATVRSVCYNPADDRILLSGGIVEGEVKVWNTETGQIVQNLKGHSGSIYDIAASGDGNFYTSVGTDKSIRIWDLRTSTTALVLNAGSFSEMNSVCQSNSATQMRAETKSNIASIFLKRQLGKDAVERSSSKQNQIAVGHSDGVVSVWDITAGKLFSKYCYHADECRSVEFSSDTKWLASASFDHSIGIVDMAQGTTCKLDYHEDRVVSIKWHPYLPILLSTSADRTARIFSI
mmetsp:Transcript_12878/g.18816  ORF Transcript_12878/g.18816 Transcript_12878/m.18816 type:complete len:657 (+) Transcript_12878:11-1981(+)